MGCRCGYSICSVCGNKAVSEDDFCEHVLNYKGSTYNGLPVFEDNRDIEFFEDSFVTTGADKSAKILEKVASKHSNIITRQNADKSDNQLLNTIIREQNQRTFNGKVNSLSEQLKNIPWS